MVRDYPGIDSAVRVQPTEAVFRLGGELFKEEVCYNRPANSNVPMLYPAFVLSK